MENERDEEAARLVTLALTLETERASVREEMRVRKYCTDIRVYVYVCVCVCERGNVFVCMYACRYCMNVYMYKHTCVGTYVWVQYRISEVKYSE